MRSGLSSLFVQIRYILADNICLVEQRMLFQHNFQGKLLISLALLSILKHLFCLYQTWGYPKRVAPDQRTFLLLLVARALL